jgi:hypothetical protein
MELVKLFKIHFNIISVRVYVSSVVSPFQALVTISHHVCVALLA